MAICVIVENPKGEPERIYALDDGEVALLPHHAVRHAFDASTQDIVDFVRGEEQRVYGDRAATYQFRSAEIDIGSYWPSVARPIGVSGRSLEVPNSDHDEKLAKTVWREHQVIAKDLETCFDVVSPEADNLDAFGTEFEKLIYFCSIGVETLFRKVLRDNSGWSGPEDMRTFSKLGRLMRLQDFALELVSYRWLGVQGPFSEWATTPEEPIGWFQAYNQLKHDKARRFGAASLRHALLAAAGYYALSFAVFGGRLFPGFLSDTFFFHFTATPKWDVTDRYFPNKEQGWSQRRLVL